MRLTQKSGKLAVFVQALFRICAKIIGKIGAQIWAIFGRAKPPLSRQPDISQLLDAQEIGAGRVRNRSI